MIIISKAPDRQYVSSNAQPHVVCSLLSLSIKVVKIEISYFRNGSSEE